MVDGLIRKKPSIVHARALPSLNNAVGRKRGGETGWILDHVFLNVPRGVSQNRGRLTITVACIVRQCSTICRRVSPGAALRRTKWRLSMIAPASGLADGLHDFAEYARAGRIPDVDHDIVTEMQPRSFQPVAF